LQVDKSRIARVISNLLSNAIKFTSEGTITISVEKDETDKNEKNCVNINVKILVKSFPRYRFYLLVNLFSILLIQLIISVIV